VLTDAVDFRLVNATRRRGVFWILLLRIIPPIQTKRIITYHLNSMYTKRSQHMQIEIQVLACVRYKGVAD
jgi:hypothetical protein